jgi:hypothetical protein
LGANPFEKPVFCLNAFTKFLLALSLVTVFSHLQTSDKLPFAKFFLNAQFVVDIASLSVAYNDAAPLSAVYVAFDAGNSSRGSQSLAAEKELPHSAPDS